MNSVSRVIDFVSPEMLCMHLREFGYEARLHSLDNGSPIIFSSMGEFIFAVLLIKADGEPGYSIASLVCQFPHCRLPLGFANRWNRERYFGKAVIDDDGDPVLEMNIVVLGVTEAYLRRCFAIWQNVSMLFMNELEGIQYSVTYSDNTSNNSIVPLTNQVDGKKDIPVRSVSRDVTSSDISEIKRLLSTIGSGIQSMSGESGSNLKAVVNRLETVNGKLGEINSYLREITNNTRR